MMVEKKTEEPKEERKEASNGILLGLERDWSLSVEATELPVPGRGQVESVFVERGQV